MRHRTHNTRLDKTWSCGMPVRSCPYMRRVRLWIDAKIYFLCRRLAEELGTWEWLIYAKTMSMCEGEILVLDPAIPRQRATPTSVEVLDPLPEYDAVVHSHHILNLHDFSNVDNEYINANNRVSILWTDDEGFTRAVVKMGLPCGHEALVDADIAGLVLLESSLEEARHRAERLVLEQVVNIEKVWDSWANLVDYDTVENVVTLKRLEKSPSEEP